MVAILTFLSGVVGYNTFLDNSPPAAIGITDLLATNDEITNRTIISYNCDIAAKEDTNFKINRRVYCNDNIYYDLPQSVIKITEGVHMISRYITLPENHPDGTRCSFTANVEWTPGLSLRPHYYETPPYPFVINDL